MQSLDVIDGGDGTDTLSIVETGAVAKLAGTFTGIEKVVVQSGGSIGAAAANATVAQKQKVTYDLSAQNIYATGDKITVTVGANSKVLTIDGQTINTGNIEAAIVAAIEAEMDKAYGDVNATPYAAVSSSVITVTAGTAGVALPSISITSDNADFEVTTTTVQSNVVAAGPVDAATFSVFKSATEVTATAVKEIVLSAGADDKVTASAGTTVKVTGGNDVTASGSGGVTVDGAAGAVVVTEKSKGNVVVTSGTTVSVTKVGATVSRGEATALGGNITIGADAQFGPDDTSVSGYPYVDNGDGQPTGNIAVSNYTNYSTLTGQASRAFGSGSATIYTNGATNVSVATGGAVTVKDVQVNERINAAGEVAKAGTSTLSTVRVEGTNATGTVTSDALTALTLVNAGASADITVTNNTLTGHALALTVGNTGTAADGAVVTDATATSVAITTEGQSISTAANASASYIELEAAVATTLSFNNAHAVTLTTGLASATKVASVTATGAGSVALGDVTGAVKLTSIDASAASGKLSATIGGTGTYGLTVKGGSGADTITLKAGASLASSLQNGATVSTTIELGDGNDKLLNGGTAAANSATVGVGTVIDAGAGTDTVSLNLVNAGNGGLFKNFETLELKGAVDTTSTAASRSFDAGLLTASSITGVSISGTAGTTGSNLGTMTVSNLEGTNVGVTVTGTGAADLAALTATLKTSTGTSDTATINYGALALSDGTVSKLAAFKTSGIETVSVNSGGVLATATANVTNTLTLFEDKSNTTTTITVTGSNAFVLGGYTNATTYADGVDQSTTAVASWASASTAAALKTIDASAMTASATIVAGATQTLTAADSTTTSLVFTGLTINGGAGADKIVNVAASGKVFGNGGDDAITLHATGASADGGAGDDIITVDAGVSTTLTGGTGADTFNVSAALGTQVITTITDFSVGDKIQFKAASSTTDFVQTKVDVGAAGTLAEALNIAASTNVSPNNAHVVWFQYAGNTYLVEDLSSATTATTSDVVVKLTGLIDLSTSTIANTELFTFA